MRVILLSMLIAAPAAAQTAEVQWDDFRRLHAAAAPCEDESLRGTGVHAPRPYGETLHLLDNMLEIDPSRCPGIPEAAATALHDFLGEPERDDVDLAFLELARRSAEQGQGMAPDPVLADLYGRMLWLFSDFEPSLQRWRKAEREAWLVRSETVALLRARNDSDDSTARSLTLESALRLRRDVPFYDPARAIDLLENSHAPGYLGSRLRLSRMMTDGTLVPPDYPRAARLFLWSVSMLQGDPDRQGELLRIGRLAAAAARTPADRAEALRMLFASSLNGLEGSREEVTAMLGRIGRAQSAALTPAQARSIFDEMGRDLVFSIPLEDDPLEIRPIRLRGLIGPAGRLVYAEVVGSSGSWFRDRVALGAWARYGDRIDLSATARGRFTWVELPAVDSRPD